MAENIKVVVRVRPFLDNERHNGCVTVTDNQIMVGDSRCFAFDKIFDMNAADDDVYATVGQPLADSFIEGFNVSMIAYGQTGAGKTFTMSSLSTSVIEEIFMRLEEKELQEKVTAGKASIGSQAAEASQRNKSFTVKVSVLEVYNEHVGDLLVGNDSSAGGGSTANGHSPVPLVAPGAGSGIVSSSLQVREDPKGGVYVPGLTEVTANTQAEVLAIVNAATATRKTASTLMNATSSRSHCIVTVMLKRKGICCKCTFIDLAGSERLKKSLGIGSTELSGIMKTVDGNDVAVMDRMREGISINSGLLALGNVIVALCEKKPHVPYRSSKLTRLLQPVLGGNSKTSMVACVSPVSSSLEETLNTLKYADRAKSIKTDPHLIVTPIYSSEEAEETILALRKELVEVQHQLTMALQRGRGGAARHATSERRRRSTSTSARSRFGRSNSTSSLLPLAPVTPSRPDPPSAALLKQVAELQSALAREQGLTRRLQEDLFNAEYVTMVEVEKRKALEDRLAELEEASTTASAISSDSPRNRLMANTALLQKLEEERRTLQLEKTKKEADKSRLSVALGDKKNKGSHLPPEQNLAELTKEIDVNAQKIEELKKENADATQRLHEYERELANANVAKQQLADKLAKAEAELEASGMTLSKREKEKEKLRAEFREKVRKAEEESLDYKRRMKNAEQQIVMRTLSIQQSEHRRQQAERLKEEVIKLRDNMLTQQRKANLQSSAHTQEVNQLQRSLQDADQQIAKLRTELQQKESEIARARSQIDSAAHQNSALVKRGTNSGEATASARGSVRTRVTGTDTLKVAKSRRQVSGEERGKSKVKAVGGVSHPSTPGESQGGSTTPGLTDDNSNPTVQSVIDTELEALEHLEKELSELKNYRAALVQTRGSDAPKWQKAIQGFTRRLQVITSDLSQTGQQADARQKLEAEKIDIENKLRTLEGYQRMFAEAGTQIEEFDNRIDSLNEARKYHLHRVRRLQNPSQVGDPLATSSGLTAIPLLAAATLNGDFALPSVREIASARQKKFHVSHRSRKVVPGSSGGPTPINSGTTPPSANAVITQTCKTKTSRESSVDLKCAAEVGVSQADTETPKKSIAALKTSGRVH